MGGRVGICGQHTAASRPALPFGRRRTERRGEMARDLLRVSLQLDHIHCYDEEDGWGAAEPYLWTVFFKVDGDGVALTDALKLSGGATVVTTPGSHGNLGTSD